VSREEPLPKADPGPAAVADASTRLLEAVRTGEETAQLVAFLAELEESALDELDDDAAKAFWLNVYNAFVQLRLAEDADRFADRRQFFGAEELTVAGADLSLDDVEHGILRRSKSKFGLGYLPSPFPGAFERRHRLESVDPRIHFALNCGAASCPPILAYEAESVDDALDVAAESYLATEVEYDPDAGVAEVPRLLLWYRGDFGGRRGIYRHLRRYGPVPADATPKVRYRRYDWSLAPGRFGIE